MAKYVVEIDTEEKTFKVSKNGTEINFSDFSCSVYDDNYPSDCNEKNRRRGYVNETYKSGDKRVSTGYSFDIDKEDSGVYMSEEQVISYASHQRKITSNMRATQAFKKMYK